MTRAILTAHPFELLSRSNRRLLLRMSGTASLFVGGAAWLVTRPLQTAAAPLGILSLELAGQPFIVRSILGNWGGYGIVRAAFCVGLGALFAFATWTFVSALCVTASEEIRPTSSLLTGAGRALAWAQFAALAAALAEEVLLLKILGSPEAGVGVSVALAASARYCAEAKYAILLGGGFFSVMCFYYTWVWHSFEDVWRLRSAARAMKS